MIKDIIDANNNVTVGAKEIEILKEHFPACFRNGSFDIERLKEYLKDKIHVTEEGYELRFLGKNYARLLASLDTTTVIVPDTEHNNLPENKDSKNNQPPILANHYLSLCMFNQVWQEIYTK